MPRPDNLVGRFRLRDLLGVAEQDFYERLIGAASQMAERVTRRRLAHHRRTESIIAPAGGGPVVLTSFPVTAVEAVRRDDGRPFWAGSWRLLDAEAGLMETCAGAAEIVYEAGYGRRQRQSITCPAAAGRADTGFTLDTPGRSYMVRFAHVGAPRDGTSDTGDRQPIPVEFEPRATDEAVAAAVGSALNRQADVRASVSGSVVTVMNEQVGAVPAAADVDAGVSVVVDSTGRDVPDDLALAVVEWIQWEAARLRSPAGVGVRSVASPDGLNTSLELDTPASVRSVLQRYTDTRAW